MPQKKSIRQVITGQTLPTLITLAFLSAVVLHAGIFYLVNADLERRHSHRAETLKQHYQAAIDEQILLVESIAAQEFIQQTLLAPSPQAQAFSLSYFQSLSLNATKDADISLFNQRGISLISTKGDTEQRVAYEQLPWFNTVLIQRQSYFYPGSKAISFVVPVLANGEVIGALAVEYPGLDAFLDFNFEDALVLISNVSNQVLYSSDNSAIAANIIIDWQQLPQWRLAWQTSEADLTFSSLESTRIYFQEIYRLLVFSLLALSFLFVSSYITTKVAGKLAAGTIDQFLASLQHIRRLETKEGYKFKLPYIEASELQQLSKEFQNLLKDVTESNLSKQRVSGLINSLNDLLVSVDRSGNIDLTNSAFDAFIEQSGINANRALETIFFNVSANKLLDINEPFPNAEKRYLIKSPSDENPYRSIRWSRHAIVDDNNDIVGMTFVGMDTTRSSALETEIRLKEAAFDGADSGILIMDVASGSIKIIYANKGAERLTGIDADELLSLSGDFLAYSQGNEEAFNNINTATRLGEPVVEVLKSKKRDNSIYHLEITMSPVKLPLESENKYYLGILKDVTERQLTAQLLIEAKKKAEESTQMKSSFLASMSHEIRTPMNGVMGMLDILKESKLDAQQKNYINIAQNSAESLLSLINDILDFSKVEAGKLEIEATDFCLNDMLDGFINTMAHQAHSKKLELILDTSAIDQQMVKGDPGRLRQIMTNLVSNAIKFTERGEILIRAGLSQTSDGKYLLNMTIKDTGIGIPHEKQARLFDPFTQVDGAHNRERQGTGLGLAIVKQLCEAMHGHVWINSQHGRGSTFGFRIQLGASDKPAPELPEINCAGKRLLIIDNNVSNAEVLQKQIHKWQVDSDICLSGQQALDQLKANAQEYDGLLVDMNMPRMDGITLTKYVREIPAYKDRKIILMTSISQLGDAQQYKALGFDDYFPKPANSADIIACLTTFFGRTTVENRAYTTAIEETATAIHTIPETEDESFEKAYRILLVEDNPVNQMISKKHIEKLGLQSTIAQDGQVAIDLLQNSDTNFDLILMDCQMPILDGFAATRKIRMGEAGDRYLNVPIVAMTANAMMGDRERCLEVGMDDYISKPLRKEILLETLKKWLSRL